MNDSDRNRGRGATRGGWIALLALLTLGACAGRQAVVESGPAGGRGPVSEDRLVAELRRLADRQEVHREESGRYTYDLAELEFSTAAGVIVDVLQVEADGFSAIATSADGELECVYFVGSAPSPRRYATVADDVACRP